jgi:hypothetical protein
MHRLESSRYNEPSRSPSPWLIQEYSSKNTKNIQAGPTSERAPPPAHTVAASPPAGSSGGEGVACRCRLPPTTTRHCRRLFSCQIWRRGWCCPCYRLPPARSDRGEVATPAGARGWGDRHRQRSRVGRRERERVAREKGIRTMSSWSSRGDKDGREWIRRIRLDLIFSGICFLKNLHL